MAPHCAVSSDSDDVESRSLPPQYCQTQKSFVLSPILVGVVCACVGFAVGSLSTSSRRGNYDASVSGVITKDAVCPKHMSRKTISPENYLAVSSTHLKLVNVTDTSVGWAPWQLAVMGNSAFLSTCTEQHDFKCKENQKNPEWKQFPGGVWAMHVDPEKDLGVGEIYEDEELIETRFQVILTNALNEPSMMHFHGFTPPSNLDGMPWISSNPIQPNHTVFYDFVLYHRGFYWMHSHLGHHAGSGLFAPIVVKDHPEFLDSIGNPTDVLMLIYDSHWRAPCAYARHLYPEECPTGGFDAWKQYTFNVNGHALEGGNRNVSTVIVEPDELVRVRILDVGTMAAYRIHMGKLKGRIIATDGRHVKNTSREISQFPLGGANRIDVLIRIPAGVGCYPIVALRASTMNETKTERGVLILKTKGSTCPEDTFAPRSNGSVKAITKGEAKEFLTNLEAKDALHNRTKSPDVHFMIKMTGEFKNATGEWLPDFHLNNTRLRLWPNIVWCRVPECRENDPECITEEESTLENTVLNMKFCQSLDYVMSNIKCDEYRCKPGQQDDARFRKTQDGRCLLADQKDEWKGKHVDQCKHYKRRPQQYTYNDHALEVCYGDRVWITYVDGGTKESHPLHLHGTHQELIKIDGEVVRGPLMDTWLLIPGGNLTVAFDAINPGEWLLHCHIEHHLMNGMATTMRYVMHDRCEKRLDQLSKPKWTATPPVPFAEWPEDWKTLAQRKAVDTSIVTAVEYP